MKPTSLNSIPRVFFGFAPIGKVEKTRFQRNWTTYVNPAFCTSWKNPPKIVVWNRPRWIRSQECFLVSPRLRKSKKRVLNAIGRPSSTRLFPLLGKAHPKWWYETDLVEFDPKGVFFVRPDWKSQKNAFSTQLDDLRQPGFLRFLEKPTQNGGMKPARLNSIPRVFFRFTSMMKVEKRVLNPIWRYSSIRHFGLLGKAHPKWWYETVLVEFDPKGVFSFRPDWERRKTRFELNLTIFVNLLFALLGKAHPKWWYETDLVEFDRKGVFSFRPDWESRKKAFSTQLDILRYPGFLRCLEKPTQILVWNRPRGIRSQVCFFFSPRWGKSKNRVFNAIGRPSSTRLFAFLGKAHPTWWYETDLVKFDPKGVFSFPFDWESRKNAFSTQLDEVRQPGFLRFLEKPTQNGGMKPAWLNSFPRVFFRFASMGKVEKRILKPIWRYSSIRLFGLLGKAHPKWWYETDLVEFDPKGVYSFRLDGESRKTRFEPNLAIFVNSAFWATWKSPPKMVVWKRPRGIRSQGCFFVSPRLGKSKNAFWTQFDDVRQFGFLRCLEKPTQNGGLKPTSWNSIPRVFIRFASMGKVEKRVLNPIWRYSSIRLFGLLGKAHPKWWYESDLEEFDPKGVFSFRPDWESRKTRFEPNLTIFVNSAFWATWKSPPKMVVWNRPRGIRSQGCFFVSSRLGKSKNAFWT